MYITALISLLVVFLALFTSPLSAGIITVIASCAATLLLIISPETATGYAAFAIMTDNLYLPVLVFAITMLVVRRWPMVTSVFMDYGTKRIALILHVAPETWKMSADENDLIHPTKVRIHNYRKDDMTILIDTYDKFSPSFGGDLLLKRLTEPFRAKYNNDRESMSFRRIDKWLQSGMPKQ